MKRNLIEGALFGVLVYALAGAMVGAVACVLIPDLRPSYDLILGGCITAGIIAAGVCLKNPEVIQ